MGLIQIGTPLSLLTNSGGFEESLAIAAAYLCSNVKREFSNSFTLEIHEYEM